MKIAFYFDPSCPFSWITSRWLKIVEPKRDLQVGWRPFSLAIKNDELASETHTPHHDTHRGAHQILRVMQAGSAQFDADFGDMYTVFGRLRHIDEREFSDEMIVEGLAELQLPPELVDAADDMTLDAVLSESTASATSMLGDDIGVPTLMAEDNEADKRGFFGPVLNALPASEDAALKLWDSLSQLLEANDLYELKRGRPSSGPDVGSTTRVFR